MTIGLENMASPYGGSIPVPYILAQSAVPVILVPNGTVATNGIVTLGIALPATYSGGAWIRLPADAVGGGTSLAGMYWCVFSSTTQGQVYTNYADPASEFIPRVPSGALVAAVGSNVAYTQDAATLTMANVTLPGGTLGLNGAVECLYACRIGGSTGGTKTVEVKYGAAQVHFLSGTTGTTAGTSLNTVFTMRNRGLTNKQFSHRLSGGASGDFMSSVDSTSSQGLALACTVGASATEYVVLEEFTLKVLPS